MGGGVTFTPRRRINSRLRQANGAPTKQIRLGGREHGSTTPRPRRHDPLRAEGGFSLGQGAARRRSGALFQVPLPRRRVICYDPKRATHELLVANVGAVEASRPPPADLEPGRHLPAAPRPGGHPGPPPCSRATGGRTISGRRHHHQKTSTNSGGCNSPRSTAKGWTPRLPSRRSSTRSHERPGCAVPKHLHRVPAIAVRKYLTEKLCPKI
ncbi:MAG: hypothetical protein CM1200mP34_3370 [Verrucomicrobiales bacterium]|nr:MAG: hypothetical protein CM1200mP34_3370 [Verrucomicrobiales bacterium]